MSFRAENEGKAVVYSTDNEPGSAERDRAIRELAYRADVLIYDSQYSQSQLEGEKKGWGHSSWEEGVRICQDAGVKELVLFHHDPDSDDDAIDQIQAVARSRFPGSRAAYEGLEIIL